MSEDVFDAAKTNVISHLERLVRFSNTLDNLYPGSTFKVQAKGLQGIANKLKGSVGPCLTGEDVNKFAYFRKYITADNQFKTKLTPLSQLSFEISKAILVDGRFRFDTRELRTNASKFMSISEVTKEARRAVLANPESILSIMTVMLLLTSRRETFYHATKNILERAIKELKLNSYDIAQMCSIESKVARHTKAGIVYESDIEAIRNCIGHAYYEIIRKIDGSYVVRFERRDMGYNFDKEFTGKQIMKFFNDYLLLEVMQGMIFTMSLHYVLMQACLQKSPNQLRD